MRKVVGRSPVMHILRAWKGRSGMEADEIRTKLKRIINGALDDCERAIKADRKQQALNELDDAITKLKKIMRSL